MILAAAGIVPPLLAKGETQVAEQILSFLVGLCGGAKSNVHAFDFFNLVKIDFRKNQLFLDAQGVEKWRLIGSLDTDKVLRSLEN